MLNDLNVLKCQRPKIVINDKEIFEKDFELIAGPCVIQSYEQVYEVGLKIKKLGGKILRGGSFKLRTSPYSFQGLGLEALKILKQVGKELDLITVSEIPNSSYINLFVEYVDIIQVGMRNMSNFELLKQLGSISKPILLKRGNSATLEEFLLAAEYIYNEGCRDIILCERGIRTFEKDMRNTLDIAGALYLKRLTKLPIIIDPSHATGLSFLVSDLVKISKFAKFDGCIIEVTNNICEAMCDKEQALDICEYEMLVKSL